MTIRVGEIGKTLYVITSFNMSNNTSLSIEATPPSGNTKTWTATLDNVGFASVTIEDGSTSGTVAANESMYYVTSAATDLDEAGDWTLVGIYQNTVPTPSQYFVSDPVTITVSDDNY